MESRLASVAESGEGLVGRVIEKDLFLVLASVVEDNTTENVEAVLGSGSVQFQLIGGGFNGRLYRLPGLGGLDGSGTSELGVEETDGLHDRLLGGDVERNHGSSISKTGKKHAQLVKLQK